MTKTGTEVTIPDARINKALRDCANDLAEEIMYRYGTKDRQGTGIHPAMLGKFKLDMSTVHEADAALASVDAPATGEQDCRDAGPGRGQCDMCAAGHYEKCRYTRPADAPAPVVKPHD